MKPASLYFNEKQLVKDVERISRLSELRSSYNSLSAKIDKWEESIDKARRGKRYGKIKGFERKIEKARKEMIEIDEERTKLSLTTISKIMK